METIAKKTKGFFKKLLGLHKTAVIHDSFDSSVFEELKEQSEKLKALEEGGKQKLPTFPPLMQDVFCSLYKAVPKLRPEKEIVSSHRYNRVLVEKLLKLPEYQELRSYTKLDHFNAAMGTLTMAQKVLELIPEETKEQLQEMNNLEQQAQSLQEETNALGQQASDLQSLAAKRTGDQVKAEQLRQQAGQLQQKQQQAQMSLEQAKARLEKMRQGLEKQIQDQAPKIRAAVRQATQEALDDVKETAELLEAWGSDPGQIQEMPYEQKVAIAERIKNSQKLKRLSKLVGRFRRLAVMKQKTKIKHGVDEVFDIMRGNDLGRLLPSELVQLAHPVLKKNFFRRFTEGTLLQYDLRGVEKQGKGPIICCIDNSGSMSGEPEIWSKAVALALLEIASMQKRSFACIHFGGPDDPIKVIEIPKGKVSLEQVFEIAEYFLGGGTDFEKPLAEAVKLIEKQEFKKADIVFISDGQCAVSDSFLARWKAVKKEKEFSCFSILIGWGSPKAMEEFSDEIFQVQEMTEDGEATEVAKTIFSEI